MSIFEFLSVSVAILLALALGKLVAATPNVFAKGRRDVLHAGVWVFMLLSIFVIWWNQWALAEKQSWHFSDFLILMGTPVFSYLAAHVLVSDSPSEISDWRKHFASIHHWYFAAVLGTAIFAFLREIIIIQRDFPVFYYVGIPVACTVLTIGIVSKNRKVHVAVTIFWASAVALGTALNFTIAEN